MTTKELAKDLKEHIGCGIEVPLYDEELEVVVEALEKQVAKKLVVWDNGTQHCSYCEHDLTYISSEDEYCCRCGTKIDWSE